MNVIFDLDGTLVDSAPDIRAAAGAVLAREGAAPLDLAETRRFVGSGAEAFVERMAQARDLAPERRPVMLRRFLALYLHATGLTRPYPGVRAALAAIAARGHGLGVCTNKPEAAARRLLADVDLGTPFGALLGGDTLAVRKPDPAPLLECAARLGGGPAVFVGDSEVDFETAHRAGLPFVLFTEGYREDPLDAVPTERRFEDFAALPGLIAGL